MKILLSLLYLIFVIAACKSAGSKNAAVNISQNTAANITKDIEVKIDFEVVGQQSRRPRITGSTNLPDRTDLTVIIENAAQKYSSQDKVMVQDGKFESREFDQAHQNLPSGEYQAEVLMPIPDEQSAKVREIIGKNGEHLKGSLMEKTKLVKTFNIP